MKYRLLEKVKLAQGGGNVPIVESPMAVGNFDESLQLLNFRVWDSFVVPMVLTALIMLNMKVLFDS